MIKQEVGNQESIPPLRYCARGRDVVKRADSLFETLLHSGSIEAVKYKKRKE
jgi:hypothetical protein